MAKDLVSPDCINWQNLENNYAMNGKEVTLFIIRREMEGANNIYMVHLNLAESTILKLN